MDAKEIRAIRKKLGLSQAKLAIALGVRENSIWRWEAGVMQPRESVCRLLRLLVLEHGDLEPSEKKIVSAPALRQIQEIAKLPSKRES
jgi:transcriptional regulator with XRE-family HTH domain